MNPEQKSLTMVELSVWNHFFNSVAGESTLIANETSQELGEDKRKWKHTEKKNRINYNEKERSIAIG